MFQFSLLLVKLINGRYQVLAFVAGFCITELTEQINADRVFWVKWAFRASLFVSVLLNR